MWEELYYEGNKFIEEREINHLVNMDKLASTIYHIMRIDKE